MQYPESTSVGVVQAWPEPGSLKPRGGHHLEPQGSRAYSSAVPRVIFLPHASGAPCVRRLVEASSVSVFFVPEAVLSCLE